MCEQKTFVRQIVLLEFQRSFTKSKEISQFSNYIKKPPNNQIDCLIKTQYCNTEMAKHSNNHQKSRGIKRFIGTPDSTVATTEVEVQIKHSSKHPVKISHVICRYGNINHDSKL